MQWTHWNLRQPNSTRYKSICQILIVVKHLMNMTPLPITQEYKGYDMESQERRQHHGHKNTTPKTPVLSPYPNPVTLVCRRIVDDRCPLPAGVHLERPIRSPLGLLGCWERQEGLILVWIIYPCARIKTLFFFFFACVSVTEGLCSKYLHQVCIYVREIVLNMLFCGKNVVV